MTQPIPTTDAKERAIVAVVNWRESDRAACADKRSRDKQRKEYELRISLRTAADNLTGARDA